MYWYRRLDRIFLGVALAGGLAAITDAPAFALGYGGDAREVAALRGAGSDRGGPYASSAAAPEIDGGTAASAIALVLGGLLVILDRRRR